jgi:hypothetical protein
MNGTEPVRPHESFTRRETIAQKRSVVQPDLRDAPFRSRDDQLQKLETLSQTFRCAAR